MIEFEDDKQRITRNGDDYVLELKYKNEGDWYTACYALNRYLESKGLLDTSRNFGPPNSSSYYGAKPNGIQKAVFPPKR